MDQQIDSEPDPRYLRYIRSVHQFDSKRGNREVLIHIPFSHQFLRDLPDNSAKHRVIADSLLYIQDFFLKTLHLPVEITPIIPFPFQQEKKRFIGLKISGPRRHVYNIEKYLTSEDVMKFIQQTRRYHKQLEHQRQEQHNVTVMAHKALQSSTLQKPFSSSIRPYPQLFFPVQHVPHPVQHIQHPVKHKRKLHEIHEIWSSPTVSMKRQNQDW